MPWWARPGPQYQRGDGAWSGSVVPWPAIDNGRLARDPNWKLNKRPASWDIREDFEIVASMSPGGELTCQGARLIPQQHARSSCAHSSQTRRRAKAGVDAIDDELLATGRKIGEIDDRLENLTVSSSDVPQQAAALLLITANYEHKRNETFDGSATLDALRPFLTGQISEHAEYAVANSGELITSMPFWSAA